MRRGETDVRPGNELRRLRQRLQTVYIFSLSSQLHYLHFFFFAGLLISNTLCAILIAHNGKLPKCCEFKIIEYNKKIKIYEPNV